MTLAELEGSYPGIPWREPVLVRTFAPGNGDVEVLACRVCVANEGLRAAEVLEAARAGDPLPQGVFEAREGWESHFREAHA